MTAKEKAVTEAQAELTAASGRVLRREQDLHHGPRSVRRRAERDRADGRRCQGRRAPTSPSRVTTPSTAPRRLSKPSRQLARPPKQELADARRRSSRPRPGHPVRPHDRRATDAARPPTPLAPAATVDRVKQAESEFAAHRAAITDQTPLTRCVRAVQQRRRRARAVAGCGSSSMPAASPTSSTQQAEAAVSAYVAALQQDLADAGYYDGAVDGVYGPMTVAAVEELQKASGLPVTGTVDKATAEALQAELVALGGAAAQDASAATAAVQQTLKLAGFWDGPVDGVWTPALTEALKAFQAELGVEPTGTVDAATISAFEKAIAELLNPEPIPSEYPHSRADQRRVTVGQGADSPEPVMTVV